MPTYKITPSQAVWEFSRCQCCFRAQVVDDWKPPKTPFPSVFGAFDRLTRQAIEAQQITPPQLHPSLPAGKLETKERRVKSIPFKLTNSDTLIYFSGRTDLLLWGDGNINGVLDLKTTTEKDPAQTSLFYAPQLHIYAWGLENPDGNSLYMTNVQHLGLVISSPKRVILSATNDLCQSDRTFVRINRDDVWFRSFLTEIVQVIENINLLYDPNCEYCEIRKNQRLVASQQT